MLLDEGRARGMRPPLGGGIHTDPLYDDSDVCGRPPTIPGMQGGGTSKRLNVAPVVVGTGGRLGHLSLLLDQCGWQAGDGCAQSQTCNWTERTDGTERSTEIPYSGVGRIGWWVEERICGFVETFNPSKQEAKGGGG